MFFVFSCATGALAATILKKGEPGKIMIKGVTSTVDTTGGLTDVENPSPRLKAESSKQVRPN